MDIVTVEAITTGSQNEVFVAHLLKWFILDQLSKETFSAVTKAERFTEASGLKNFLTLKRFRNKVTM